MEQRLKFESAASAKRGALDARTARTDEFRMQELHPEIRRSIAEIVNVARILGIDRSHWSMAFETDSLAIFDGLLNGTNAST